MAIDVGIIVTAFDKASGVFGNVKKKVENLGFAATASANRLKAIDVVLAGIIAKTLYGWGKAFVEAEARVQSLDVRMVAWTGNVKTAHSVLDTFANKLGAAGISLDKMGNGFIKLRASGVDVATATKTVESLVNSISAIGGDDLEGKFTAASSAFQLFLAKGFTGTKELRSILTSAGITVQELADKLSGGNVPQFWENLRLKSTSAGQVLTAFNDIAQKKFGDFASLLDGTVGGAISKFKIRWDEALVGIGDKGAFSQIATDINKVDDAIMGMVNAMSSDDIDKFFTSMHNVAGLLGGVAKDFWNIASAIGSVAEQGSGLLSSMPADAVTGGIIGYYLFGKTGPAGLAGALLGAILPDIPKIGTEWAIQLKNLQISADDPNNPGYAARQRDLIAKRDALQAELPNVSYTSIWNKIRGTGAANPYSVERGQSLAAIQAQLNGSLGGKPTGAPGTMSHFDAASSFQGFQNTISGIGADNGLLGAKNASNDLAIKIAEIMKTTDSWFNTLTKAGDEIRHSKLPLADQKVLLDQINNLGKAIGENVEREIEIQISLNQLAQEELRIKLQIGLAEDKIAATTQQRQLDQLKSPWAAILQGTGFNKYTQQSQDIQNDSSLKIQQMLGQANAFNADSIKNPQNQAGNDLQVEQLTNLINLQREYGDAATASALMASDAYQNLGDILQNDVLGGIKGVISGTETWQQAAGKLFEDLISWAAEYIIKLLIQNNIIEIQIVLQAILDALGGGGTASGGIGQVGKLANGGTAQGLVTPFASGGITKGPTLFGLMGEAGTEAVMPLTMVNGKLGVSASGNSGGNHYHITVNAVDTQTGLEFLGKHIGNIDAGLHQHRALNGRAGAF